jgi:hypothetical protein
MVCHSLVSIIQRGLHGNIATMPLMHPMLSKVQHTGNMASRNLRICNWIETTPYIDLSANRSMIPHPLLDSFQWQSHNVVPDRRIHNTNIWLSCLSLYLPNGKVLTTRNQLKLCYRNYATLKNINHVLLIHHCHDNTANMSMITWHFIWTSTLL